jgi:hypothetical protein
MEILIGIIVLLAGGLFYVNNKRKQAEVKGIVADVTGQDKQLEKQQIKLKEEIQVIDSRIEQVRKEREAELKAREDDHLTLAERAKLARDKFSKGNENE